MTFMGRRLTIRADRRPIRAGSFDQNFVGCVFDNSGDLETFEGIEFFE